MRRHQISGHLANVVKTRPTTHSFWLPATSAAPRLARRWLVAECHCLGPEQLSIAELLTGELVANAVLHAAGSAPGSGPGIVVNLECSDQLLRLEVVDGDPRPLPPVRAPIVLSERGMGLHLVSELATRWGSHPTPTRDGKVVWFELRP
jgi:anti-sigma regulatory factor (Ser/Thr protein kinase)